MTERLTDGGITFRIFDANKKQNVTIEDLETAADWLDANEGEFGEVDSCRRVAAWIRREVNRRLKR